MRRMFMLVGLSALFLVLAVGVAVAVDYKVKQCSSIPCKGTDGNDLMYERQGQERDRIYGNDGKDRLVASTFKDDKDRLFGDRGDDVLFTNDGDRRDLADGGRGRDRCVVDRGDVVRSCTRVNSASTEAATLLKEVEQTGGP